MVIRTDKDWLAIQVAKAGIAGTPAGMLVHKVINALESADIEEKNADMIDDLVTLAVSLFKGRPILVDDGRQWTDYYLGDVNRGATVRVKPDAYLGSAGAKHNGKVGRLIGVHGYTATIVYEGQSADTATNHRADRLQKLV